MPHDDNNKSDHDNDDDDGKSASSTRSVPCRVYVSSPVRRVVDACPSRARMRGGVRNELVTGSV
ncbi:hypothetical protein NCCP2495_34260 [Dietzia sp. NCCP-2495]|nr:hypothetical protein NCCP2495_34260 [Dietzia sp. NCCP-2495]